jgi:hypothetical protein
VALKLSHPLRLAAIDAGSNAFRLILARVHSAVQWEIIESIRAPVRLGHSAFSAGKFDRKTLRAATEAFRLYRRTMRRHGVTAYRAVATSATREARNRHVLVDAFFIKPINLEVISRRKQDCARGHVVGVANAASQVYSGPGRRQPGDQRIARRGSCIAPSDCRWAPSGWPKRFAFRKVHEQTLDDLERRVLAVLQSALPNRPQWLTASVAACGGNARHWLFAAALAGAMIRPASTFATALKIQLDVEGRIGRLARRDRAEVMGVAAAVLVTVAKWLRPPMAIPGGRAKECQATAQHAAGAHHRGASSPQKVSPERSCQPRATWYTRDKFATWPCSFLTSSGCTIAWIPSGERCWQPQPSFMIAGT